MDRTDHKNDCNHQQDQPGILLLVVIVPSAPLIARMETQRQYTPVHPVHRLLYDVFRLLIGPDEVETDRDPV